MLAAFRLLRDMIDLHEYLMPLFAVTLIDGKLSDTSKARYLGVCFHVNDQGVIATCKHVVELLQEGETLLAHEATEGRSSFIVTDIKRHPKFDFAIGRVSRKKYQHVPISSSKFRYIGEDVSAYGFTSSGISGGKLSVPSRLFKGHLVRVRDSSF
ncbi:MAG: hypothetical protein ACI9SP_004294 [Arenicella sp.]